MSPLRFAAKLGGAIAITGTAIAVMNSAYLNRQNAQALSRRLDQEEPSVSVLVPMRNEQRNVDGCLTSLAAVTGADEVLVMDDDSTDETAAIVDAFAAENPIVRVVPNEYPDLPDHWLGKNWACVRLAREAQGEYLAFVDADVRLERDALQHALALAADGNFDMVSPYPRQETPTIVSEIIQPLLQWSWMSFVPLALSNSTQRPSLAVGNGQFFVIKREIYESVGGHAAVANDVTEDIALARLLRKCGHRTAVTNGADIATCTMYANDHELIEGYTKSLAHAFGGPKKALAIIGFLKLGYVIPPLAIVFGRGTTRIWGLIGYSAAVTGRVVVARETQQRVFPDAFTQPAAIAGLALLTTRSIAHTKQGILQWRGRAISAITNDADE